MNIEQNKNGGFFCFIELKNQRVRSAPDGRTVRKVGIIGDGETRSDALNYAIRAIAHYCSQEDQPISCVLEAI